MQRPYDLDLIPEPNIIDPVTGYSLSIPIRHQGFPLPWEKEHIQQRRAELGIDVDDALAEGRESC